MFAEFARRLLMLFRRRQFNADLDEEMRLHRELREQEQIERGLSRKEAHYAAQKRFGNDLALREESRDVWGFRWLETLLQDLRFGARRLRRNPGFTAVAVLTLALGIGANIAIFSLVNALILRPLPVRDPERLVRIGSVDNQGGIQVVPSPMLARLRDEPLLDGVCGVQTPLTTVEVGDATFPVGGLALSGDCYATLGVRPVIGRLLNNADDVPNGPRVTVLSYKFWKQEFGGDPTVLGESIRIEGVPFTIVGVTEPRFLGLLLAFPPSVSFAMQQQVDPRLGDKHPNEPFYWAFAFVRIRPGVSLERLRARLGVEWKRLLDESLPSGFKGADRDEILKHAVAVAPGAQGLDYTLRNRFRRPLIGLLVIGIAVLLITSINQANLLLARGLQRRHEFAIRLALGAGEWRLMRALVAESALLVAAGLGAALLLADAGDRVLLAVVSQTYSGFSLGASPDLRVLLFASGVALSAFLLSGLLPAWQSCHVNLAEPLKSSPRSATSADMRGRKALISAQVSLTLALVMVASLFVETLRHLREEPLGFGVEGVLNTQLIPLPGGYANGFSPAIYYRALLHRMQSLPGVRAASLSNFSPLFSVNANRLIRPAGVPDVPALPAQVELASDGFLATMRIPLLRGRDFHRSDAPDSPKTVIVSESLAKHLFPAGEAVGEHLSVGSVPGAQDVEIVGVAADARLWDPRARDLSFVYLDYWQFPRYQGWGNVQLRCFGDPARLIPLVRDELRRAGHEYALHLRALVNQRDISLLQEKLLALLGTAFGSLALTLAGVGLFGLLGLSVASRTREIAVRVALGATPYGIAWLVIREVFVLVAFGFTLGLPLSYAGARAISALLYGVEAVPIFPLALSMAALLAVAGAATLIPVRRATKVDPMVALRYE